MPLSVKSLRSPRQIALAISVAVYFVLWLGGVGQHLFESPARKEHDWIASLFLLLAGLVVLLGARPARDLVTLLGIAALGFAIEVIGVRTGLPFGAYSYTAVLQPQLFGVPIVMAFAWMVLVAGIKQTLQGFGLARWLEALLGALWMTAVDLVIDPLAANLFGYWHWPAAGNYYGIPVSNFVGWFLASLLVFALLDVRWKPNDWSRWTGLSIVLFFTLIALAHQIFLVGLIGLGLCGMQIRFASGLVRKN
jgi:putative membrane protein